MDVRGAVRPTVGLLPGQPACRGIQRMHHPPRVRCRTLGSSDGRRVGHRRLPPAADVPGRPGTDARRV